MNSSIIKTTLVISLGTFLFASCEKDAHVIPKVTFKTASGYTSADGTAAKGASLLVGVKAEKTEDELKTFNVSVAYDGSATTTSQYNKTLTSKEEDGFETEYTIVTRAQAGTEKWSFTVTDKDGNIATQTITLTVS
jgi:hypothetical protein